MWVGGGGGAGGGGGGGGGGDCLSLPPRPEGTPRQAETGAHLDHAAGDIMGKEI